MLPELGSKLVDGSPAGTERKVDHVAFSEVMLERNWCPDSEDLARYTNDGNPVGQIFDFVQEVRRQQDSPVVPRIREHFPE